MKTWDRILLFAELVALAIFLFNPVPTRLSASDPGHAAINGNESDEFVTRYRSALPADSKDASVRMLYGIKRIDGDQALNSIMNTSAVTTPFQVFLPLSLAPSSGYNIILWEGFEGNISWNIFDSVRMYGQDWGWRECRPYTGDHSAWIMGKPVMPGTAPVGCGSGYDGFMDVWMIYGPFSLTGATAADLQFKMWLYSEPAHDYLCQLTSIDGSTFGGVCFSGYWAGWGDVFSDLTDIPYIGNAAGKPDVWIAFRFNSDRNGVEYAEGAYVDDVVVRSCSSNCVPPSAATRLSPVTIMKNMYTKVSLPK